MPWKLGTPPKLPIDEQNTFAMRVQIVEGSTTGENVRVRGVLVKCSIAGMQLLT